MSINRRLRNWSTSMWHKVFQKQCYWHFGPSNFLEGEGLCCFFKKGGTVLHIVRYLAACLDLTLRCQQHPTRSYEKKNVSRHCQVCHMGQNCLFSSRLTGIMEYFIVIFKNWDYSMYWIRKTCNIHSVQREKKV